MKFKRGKGLRRTEQDGTIVNACTDPKDDTENKQGRQPGSGLICLARTK